MDKDKTKLARINRIAIIFISVGLLSGTVATSASIGNDERRTNILLIVTDDQRWDELGLVQREQRDSARFPFIKTPRLDNLAAQGMRFRNAFVTTSLCSPSRSAMLTGQYNHTNGIIDNATAFSPRPTWATALQAAGYNTAYFGKWHHGDKQWDRPGFDYIATFRGQGRYNDTTFKINNEWFSKRTRGYVDGHTVDFAIEFLEDVGNEPFAMMVGFKAVHQPFTPMQEHAENYSSDSIIPAANWNAMAPWKNKAPLVIPRKPRNPKIWMNILRTLDGVDKNVGRLLDALDELKLADNTLVIFTSDNGFYLGEHHLSDKRSAYEESIRIPLIARLPGVIPAGSTSENLVLNIDLAPTIIDIALQQEPGLDMHGLSLRPLFEERPGPWREAFLYEYWQESGVESSTGVPQTPTILAVRTPTHKLITYPGFSNWTELFDLEADPYETRNLVGYSKEVNRHVDMCNLLAQTLKETDFVDRDLTHKWLGGDTDVYFPGQARAKTPTETRRPPLLHPNC